MQLGIVVASACLYGIAYVMPHYFWGATFVSMLLLMRMTASPRFFFIYGFVWALLAYGIVLSGVFVGIYYLAAYRTFVAWLPGLMVLVYIALLTGIVWLCGASSEQLFAKRFTSCTVWRACWMTLYWHIMTYMCLWPVGRCEGCLLLSPLIPWAEYPELLCGVTIFGVTGMTLVLCLCAAWAARVHVRTVVIGVGIVFYVFSLLFKNAGDAPEILLAHVTKKIMPTDDYAPACRLMRDCVRAAALHKQNCIAAVFPESAVYAWELCARSVLAEHLDADDPVQDYLVGSFYDEHGVYRNSCYWLRGGRVQQRFDKRHAMPLIERMPWFLKGTYFETLFFAHTREIVPSTNERPLIVLGDFVCVPYICSELFFNQFPDDAYPQVPIIALVNDSWVLHPYLQHLMYLGAVLQAYAWQRAIVYVSYTRCVAL